MGKVTKLKPRKRPAQQLVVHQPQAPVSEIAQAISRIVEASKDKSIDLARYRELNAIRKELMAEQAEMAFTSAHKRASSRMKRIITDKENTQTRSRYATLASLDRAIRNIIAEEGFTILFTTEAPRLPEHKHMVLFLKHEAGHTERVEDDFPISTKGPKGGDVMTPIHAGNSVNTTGRRQLLKFAFSLAEADEDDDGNLAGVQEFITPEQAAKLEKLITEAGRTVEHFCRTQKIDALLDLPAHRYQPAVAMIARALAEKRGQ